MNQPKFDFIVLVAKKACVLFRTARRLIKARDGFLPYSMPIIINTRTMRSYTYKENDKKREDIKILIFDDILNNGRNVEKIASHLNDQGIRNIFYSALGVNINSICWDKKAKTEDEFKFSQSVACIRENILKYEEREEHLKGDYIIEFKNAYDVIIDAEEKKKLKINFYVPKEFKDNFLYNPIFILEREQLLNLANRINSIAHYVMVPYTGYFPFALGNDKSFSNGINFTRLYSMSSLEMFVDVCVESKIKILMFPFKNNCNFKNGFFSGVRLMYNEETNEYAFHPLLILPIMKVAALQNLYRTLFDGAEVFKRDVGEGDVFGAFDLDWNNGMDDGIDMVENKKYEGFYYNYKYLYEAASRRMVSMLSIIHTIEWLSENSIVTEKEEYAILDNFARSFRKLYRADKQNDPDYINTMINSIKKCRENYKKNKNTIFNFIDNYYDNKEYNFSDFIEVRDDVNHKREETERKDVTLSLLKSELDIPVELKDRRNHRTTSEYNDIAKAFNEFASKMNNSDITRAFKLIPIPTILIIEYIHNELNPNIDMTNDLFIDCVTSLFSANEDGRSGCCIYAEPKRFENGVHIGVDKDKFIIANCYQCGELSIKQVYDIIKYPRLLSYLVSAQTCCNDFYEDPVIIKEKLCKFAKDVSKLLDEYDFILEEKSLNLVLTLSLKDYYSGNMQIKNADIRNRFDESKDLHEEIKTLISNI
jgi:hypothetical protein